MKNQNYLCSKVPVIAKDRRYSCSEPDKDFEEILRKWIRCINETLLR